MVEEVTPLAKQLFKLFVNRSDAYARQFKNGEKKAFALVQEPLTSELIQEHLNQTDKLGVYQLNHEHKAKWVCFDFDLNTEEDYNNALALKQYLLKQNYHPLLELSGGGDYKAHVWVFCELTQASILKAWGKWVVKQSECTPHEIFPKQTELDKQGFGNLVKLPLGINLSTNRLSYFLDASNQRILEQEALLRVVNYHLQNLDVVELPEGITVEPEKTYTPIVAGNANDWDGFFEYCLSHDLPAGITKQATIGEKEAGINNNILKNEAIWLLKKGYTLETLEQKIKPLFQEKKWPFADLKGWFVKATKGELKEIATGELVNWCKEFLPELLNYIPQEEPFLQVKDLKYTTKHLPLYHLIDEIIPLKGEEYRVIKKTAYDLCVSLAVPENLRMIKIGQIETDLRVHPVFVVPSGGGKITIKEGIKKVLLMIKPDANIKEPTTAHKEQLIGKIIKRKNKETKEEEYLPKLGYVFSDLLVIEEAYELLNSDEPNEVQSRDILLRALDIYGKNLIEKQNIDNLDTANETIRGYPHGNGLLFVQPLPFKEKLVTKGTLRRLEVGYAEFPLKSPTDNFVKRLNAEADNTKAIIEFSNHLMKIKALSSAWKFEPEAYEAFVVCHKALLEQGYAKSGKSTAYTRMIEYHIQNKLLKYSGLRALSCLRTNITKRDVELAFVDIIERFVHELLFIDQKVTGALDYGASWGGVTGKRQQFLEWLHTTGQSGREVATLKIYQAQEKLSEILGKSMRTAREVYTKLKGEKLIDDWKGQHESKVWLLVKPKITSQTGESGESGRGINPKKIYNDLLDLQTSSDSISINDDKNKLISPAPALSAVSVSKGFQSRQSDHSGQSGVKSEIIEVDL